ncbi:MAG: type II toxin-antitoxin system RelE/ParE family toxin [FCB group bacterium]|nr:type II toxin-antitoxin system RelE/ParE family toxin [FCB group bacterium]
MLKLFYFINESGKAPAYEWVKDLPEKVREKAYARMLYLKERGFKILDNRTEAAYLRDDIYELRWQRQGKYYRLLFFFHGQTIAILSHGIFKTTDKIPPRDIDKAVERKTLFISNPDRYSMKI